MSDEWIIYHNNRCSKSRQVLALLYEHNITPRVVDYLRDPLSRSELVELFRKLKTKPRDVLRTKEPVFAKLSLDLKDDDAVISAILEHPILLERPLVVHKSRAVVGRPVEKVLELIRKP